MGKKYFTISYDDGCIQDENIIELMEKYGIRGTFNLNSGLFGTRYRLYLIPGTDIALSAREKQDRRIVESVRMTEEKAREVYAREFVEVASHGTNHVHENELDEAGLEAEVKADIKRLSEMFGYPVRGHIFPNGQYSDEVLGAMKDSGACYGRKAVMMKKPKDFSFNPSYGIIDPTCWHLDKFAEELLAEFIAKPIGDADEDMVFYMWGHGYELSFGSERGCFEHIEKLFKMVAEAEDVICVTNAELIDAINAGRAAKTLEKNDKGIPKATEIGLHRLYKPEVIPVWGDKIPYNTGAVKKSAMNISKKPLPLYAIGWGKDIFGKGVTSDASNLDTFSYNTWIASGNESLFFDDVPNIEPFIAEGADTAVVIAPGGGFCNKSYESEGYNIARFLNANGISAFVLDYRLNPYEAPVDYLDMQRAIRYVRFHADEYGLDKNKIGAMGFSAGGYVTGAAAILLGDSPVDYEGYESDEIDKENGIASFLGMIYPVTGFNQNPSMLCLIGGDDFFDASKRPALQVRYDLTAHVTADCPPQFLCYGSKDMLKDMIDYDHKLGEIGARHKTLVMEGASHGFSLDQEKYASWGDEFVKWIRETLN